MKKKKTYHKKYKFTYIKTTLFSLFVGILFLVDYTPFEKTGENFFYITLNGREVGTVDERAKADELLWTARRNVASAEEDLVFVETNMAVAGEELLWGEVDSEEDVLRNMEKVLFEDVQETMHRSYTVKVNEYMVNLASRDEAVALLQAAVDKFDANGEFKVELTYDESREFGVLTPGVIKRDDVTREPETDYTEAGVEVFFATMDEAVENKEELGFEDYELGAHSMGFSEKVEIVEAYLPESQLTPLPVAIEDLIKEQETVGIYTVVSGDTLSEIAIKVNIPMDELIAMNDSLKDENTTLRIDQELIITVPEPELSVVRQEQNYYEETYDAEVVIIDVDNWYTNQTEILQQPSAGFRKVVADVTFVNGKEVSREILKEEVVMEAVPKIMKRGTKTPPTYVKPISGGRVSSSFGYRKKPTAGATSYHQGIDWATPTGTSVYASCGGTVAKAGWGNGYGYCVYINHVDGRQTRYAHLSKVLVSAGQTVRQGDKIALSGNTGVSTGPHLHFEIRINGKAVNPLNYLQ